MLTEDDRKQYRMAVGGLRAQRQVLHIRKSKLEKVFFAEVKRLEKGLAKNKELEGELRAEMEAASKLPF